MQITLNIDIDDFVAFQRHYRLTNSSFRAIYYIAMTITFVVISVTIINMFSVGHLSNPVLPLFILLFFVIWSLSMYSKKYIKWGLRKLIKKEKDNPQVFGERTFLFENDYFFIKTIQSESKIIWTTIRKVDETPDYFYLYISNFSAYIIPKQKIGVQVQSLQEILHQHIPIEKYKMCKK